MRNLATDADRIVAVGLQVIAAAFYDAATDAEVSHAVRHLRHLYENPAWVTECFVHIPEWTRTAEPRELKARRAVALGDVAGLVHAHEVERNAARARAL